MSDSEATAAAPSTPLTGLVPMVPVLEVERSVEFYKLLGFAVGNREPKDGPMGWAWLYTPGAPDWRRAPNLMLTCAERAIPTDDTPRTLFYCYANDLVGLRAELERAGLKPGPITYPFYLPKGEFELHDPDGHCVMIAQNAENTP